MVDELTMVSLPVKRVGTVKVKVGSAGDHEVEAWFFDFNGVELAVTEEPYRCGYFRVFEPVSGLGISLTRAETRDGAYSRFLKFVPVYNEEAKARGRGNMMAVIKAAQVEPQRAILEAVDRNRETMERPKLFTRH